MWMIWVAVLSILEIYYAEAACTFPSQLTGIWHGSDIGQAVFTSSQFTLSNKLMKIDSNTQIMSQFNAVTFNCEDTLGNILYIKSDEFTQYFAQFRITMCWNIESSESSKIVYNSAQSVMLNTTNARFKLQSASATFSIATDCVLNGPYDASAVRVLVKDGGVSSASISCPSDFLGKFTYEFDAGSATQCTSNSYMESCTEESQIVYNYTLCSAVQAYSSEGILNCVYYVATENSTYVTVYNSDSSVPDELTTFRFSCYSISSISNATATATQYPQACMKNQVSTAYATHGGLLTLTQTSVITPENIFSAATVVSLCVVVLLMIGVISIVFYCWKKKKQLKKVRPDSLTVKAPPIDHFDRVGSSMSRCGAVSPYSPYPTLSEIAVFRFGPSPIPDCDGGTTLGGTIAPGLPEEDIAHAIRQRFQYEMDLESETETSGQTRPVHQGDPDNISLPMYSENGMTTPEPTRIRDIFDQLGNTTNEDEPDTMPQDGSLNPDKGEVIKDHTKQNGTLPKVNDNPKEHINEMKLEKDGTTLMAEDEHQFIDESTKIENDTELIINSNFDKDKEKVIKDDTKQNGRIPNVAGEKIKKAKFEKDETILVGENDNFIYESSKIEDDTAPIVNKDSN
ncbi:uncharacterized protein [Mytilus edulis]|uniref:uncharacterized protein n=1 Tax=Mytilus edulis TaxID=6550 RepID=UPI0039EE5DEB